MAAGPHFMTHAAGIRLSCSDHTGTEHHALVSFFGQHEHGSLASLFYGGWPNLSVHRVRSINLWFAHLQASWTNGVECVDGPRFGHR